MAMNIFRAGDPTLRSDRDLDNFFSNVFMPMPQSTMTAQPSRVPRHINLDVKETENQFLITADMPGCQKDDVSVDVDENIVTISAEKKSETKDESPEGADFPKYHRIERTTEFSSRTIRMPENVNMETLTGKMDHGVLSLSMDKHKAPKEPPTRKVTIN